MSLEAAILSLRDTHNFSKGSIQLLQDKGFEEEGFNNLNEYLNFPDESFVKRELRKYRIETILDKGFSPEITTGRYSRYLPKFSDISSEQALVQGRMKFAIEYIIALSDTLSKVANPVDTQNLFAKPFTNEDKDNLRSIYTGFRTKDYLAIKEIEKKTNHDIVAANTWVTIRAQQLGFDDNTMRGLMHFARTSADVNTNVTGELYMQALGEWTHTLAELVGEFQSQADKYKNNTCIARTHGQEAQLTTLGHIYANFAEQIALHAAPFLQDEQFQIDGKIAGAIGTDVDMHAAFPDVDFNGMYTNLVENKFGLNMIDFGNDQDCSNASLARMFDTISNVNLAIKKAATDIWLYASHGTLAKITTKGESGSSAMPQKANPFLAEGCEALMSISNSMLNPIKDNIIAYREQGDLRRSITKREGFHPIMLSIIGMKRLIGEIKKYEPNIPEIENQIYQSGPKIISSALNTYLRKEGVSDAYDQVKRLVMQPRVTNLEMRTFLRHLEEKGTANSEVKANMESMLYSVLSSEALLNRFYSDEARENPKEMKLLMQQLRQVNTNVDARSAVLGKTVAQTEDITGYADNTKEKLWRYSKR